MDEKEVESLARESGWKPEEEWEGDPPKHGFKTAEEFLEDSKVMFPAIKKENQKLKEQLKQQQSDLKDLRSAAAEFRDFTQRQMSREREEHEARVRQLEAIRTQAVNESDGEAFNAAEQELQRLQAQAPAQPPAQPQLTPDQQRLINEFIAGNPWYENDPVMRDWADGYAAKLRQGGALPGQPIFAAVAEEARRLFPDRISSKPGGDGRPGGVEGRGGTTGENYGRKTFDDLPAEAQEAYHRFNKLHGGKYSKKEYLQQYEWD